MSKQTLIIILLLVIMFMLIATPDPDKLIYYEDGVLKYPGDLKTRDTDTDDDTDLLRAFGFNHESFQGDEAVIAYGGFYTSNLEDLKTILSNERFVADFESEHQVVIPETIMIPAHKFEDCYYSVFIKTSKKVFSENECIRRVVVYSTDSRNGIVLFSSGDEIARGQIKKERALLSLETKEKYITKEYDGKKIYCFLIPEDSDYNLEWRPFREEQTIYLWEEDGFISMVYMDEPYDKSHLEYCELEEYRIR